MNWLKKVLLAKIETVYGTDPVATGAANAILAKEVRLTPMEGEDRSRDLERPYFGGQPTVPLMLHAKLAFKVELAGSGAAGTAPAWGPLLRACGMAEAITPGVSVAYNPITDNPESIYISLHIDGTLHALKGARGKCTLRLDAQAIPHLEFEFTGLWVQPTDVADPVPTLTAFQKPLAATTVNTPTFTLAGTALVMKKFALDVGNTVEGRFLVGGENVLITDRRPMIETTIEAVALATFNPYALAAAQTDVAVSLVHGTAAGNIATLAVAKAQMQRPQGLENSQNTVEWPLKLAPQPAAGNDDFTLTLT